MMSTSSLRLPFALLLKLSPQQMERSWTRSPTSSPRYYPTTHVGEHRRRMGRCRKEHYDGGLLPVAEERRAEQFSWQLNILRAELRYDGVLRDAPVCVRAVLVLNPSLMPSMDSLPHSPVTTQSHTTTHAGPMIRFQTKSFLFYCPHLVNVPSKPLQQLAYAPPGHIRLHLPFQSFLQS